MDEENTFPAPQSRNEAILQNMLGEKTSFRSL